MSGRLLEAVAAASDKVDEEVDEEVDKEVDEEVDTCCPCDPSARSLTCWPRMPGIPPTLYLSNT